MVRQVLILGGLSLLLLGCPGSPPAPPPVADPAAPPALVPSPAPADGPEASGLVPAAQCVRAATTSPVAWAAETVFYEVFVRSFADSDGDGIGDLDGLRLRLDYLADLGIRGLWLTPVFVAASYHGYDTVDHDHVDPVLGGDEALQRLLLAAHARGIRVLLDLVLNHTSAEHPWFVAARQGDPRWRNWYVWRDAAPVPTWTQPWGTAALIATSGLPPESRADSERLS